MPTCSSWRSLTIFHVSVSIFYFAFQVFSCFFLYCLFTFQSLKAHCFELFQTVLNNPTTSFIIKWWCWLLFVSTDIVLMSCSWISCNDFSLKDVGATYEFSMLLVKSSHFCEKFTIYYPLKSLRFTRCHNSTGMDWQLRVCMPYLLSMVLTTNIPPSLGASLCSFFIVCTTNILCLGTSMWILFNKN